MKKEKVMNNFCVAKKKSHKINRGQRGFTLIETMIALGILTYIILQVIETQSGAIFFSNYSSNLITASNLAREKMTELELLTERKKLKDVSTYADKGKFEKFPEFSYEVKIQDTKIKIPLPKQLIQQEPMIQMLAKYLEKDIFSEGVVKIIWQEGKHKQSIQVRQLFANWAFLKDLKNMANAPGL